MKADNDNSLCAGRDWNVVYTNIKCEFRAKEGLKAKGYPVFLPTLTKRVTHARKVVDKTYPLFPRYVFVCVSEHGQGFLGVRKTDGVESVLMADGRPGTVPGDTLQHLERIAGAGMLNESTAILPAKPGDLVKVMSGPFAGHIARLQSRDGNDRCKVLFELMDSSQPVDVPIDILRVTDYSQHG